MQVPPFSQYYPTEADMTPVQRRFYVDLEARLRRGECPNVDGNVSYVFAFVYKLITSVKRRGFGSLHDFLMRLAEGYDGEEPIPMYCRHWAYDCLLGEKRFELYLEKTEPPLPLGVSTHPSNLRLNVAHHCGLEANPIDVLRMFTSRDSAFVKEHTGLYRDCIREVFAEFAAKEGRPWFSILKSRMDEPDRLYPHPLFQGAVIPLGTAELCFGTRCFYASFAMEAEAKELAKAAEDRARSVIGVPKVGEGWVSETALFRSLESHFQQTVTVQHGQPTWLGRQHFDVWFPDWEIAVEFHGEQHFQPVEFFGGAQALEDNVRRDARKAALARRHRVKLFVVTKDDNIADLITKIEQEVRLRKPALPPEGV